MLNVDYFVVLGSEQYCQTEERRLIDEEESEVESDYYEEDDSDPVKSGCEGYEGEHLEREQEKNSEGNIRMAMAKEPVIESNSLGSTKRRKRKLIKDKVL